MQKSEPWVKKEEIEIFMQNHSTKDEAIRHLNRGSHAVPVNEWELYIKQYNDIDISDYSIEKIKAGKIEDLYFVEYKGVEYILVYIL